MSNYSKIIDHNLEKLYDNLSSERIRALPCRQNGEELSFKAFGEACRIVPDAIFLSEEKQTGPIGILISLYALGAQPESCIIEPLKAFRELNGSMPYIGAFSTHTEQMLIPHVEQIEKHMNRVIESMGGQPGPPSVSGDFSFILHPFPKIALCYIFYQQDEDFPAAVTCLFSNNASTFLPVDALADVAEYTSKKILQSVRSSISP
jgi:hypothetical protein